MGDDQAEVDKRRKALWMELDGEAKSNDAKARCQEILLNLSFYISMVFGGLAVAAGLIKSYPVAPELISLFAAIATGATFYSREAKLRARADWFYAVRDTAQELINRLDYEMPIPITRDNVAAISREWRDRRRQLGEEMRTINKASPTEISGQAPKGS